MRARPQRPRRATPSPSTGATTRYCNGSIGYLDGDKIVPAHVTGNDVGQLGVTYPGEASPSHVMRLRQLADALAKGLAAATGTVGVQKITVNTYAGKINTSCG